MRFELVSAGELQKAISRMQAEMSSGVAYDGPFCQHKPGVTTYRSGHLVCTLCDLPIGYLQDRNEEAHLITRKRR